MCVCASVCGVVCVWYVCAKVVRRGRRGEEVVGQAVVQLDKSAEGEAIGGDAAGRRVRIKELGILASYLPNRTMHTTTLA
jgi:hypothetical protein